MYHRAVCRAVSCGLNPSLPTGCSYSLDGFRLAAGTSEMAIPRLDHFKELGVTHVELLPNIRLAGTHS